jgi:hypothetical protein
LHLSSAAKVHKPGVRRTKLCFLRFQIFTFVRQAEFQKKKKKLSIIEEKSFLGYVVLFLSKEFNSTCFQKN